MLTVANSQKELRKTETKEGGQVEWLIQGGKWAARNMKLAQIDYLSGTGRPKSKPSSVEGGKKKVDRPLVCSSRRGVLMEPSLTKLLICGWNSCIQSTRGTQLHSNYSPPITWPCAQWWSAASPADGRFLQMECFCLSLFVKGKCYSGFDPAMLHSAENWSFRKHNAHVMDTMHGCGCSFWGIYAWKMWN